MTGEAGIGIREAASRLGISRNTVFRMLRRGDLRGYQLTPGGRTSPWRITTVSIEDLEEKRRRQT